MWNASIEIWLTIHGAQAVCGVGLYPRHVHLFIAGGPQLSKADPQGLLQGRAKTVRYVVLNATADFDRPEIEVLMAAALKLAKVRLDVGSREAEAFGVVTASLEFIGRDIGQPLFQVWKADTGSGRPGWQHRD